jgi:hypothetical protein
MDPNLNKLYDFVADCYLEYSSKGLEPGNFIDGDWELCHHPMPKCEGGIKVIWLLKYHHAIHNVLQSEWLQRVCVFGWEYQFLDDSLKEVHRKWMKEKGRMVGETNKDKKSSSWETRKSKWSEVCSFGGKASAKARKERGETFNFERMSHEDRVNNGKIGGLKRAESLNKKEWKDPFDGYIGSAACVAVHMKQHGRNPKLKVKISDS